MREIDRRLPDLAASVDRDGVLVAEEQRAVIDVLFGGQWVWSFHAGRDAKVDGAHRRARWPVNLRQFPRGTGKVTVRERFGERVLFDGEYAFDDSDHRVRIVDAKERPLIIDKAGDLQCGFSERGEATVNALLDAIVDVLDRLRGEGGVDAFLAFGALLGAVRDGRFIPHDSDADVAYLSRHTSPVDVARESYALERIMIRAGYRTWRFSAADFKVIVPDPEGGGAIDIFAGFVVAGTFYLMPEVHAPDFDTGVILPLGEVELEGRRIVAPADPEALLEITYGPHWRIRTRRSSSRRRAASAAGSTGGYGATTPRAGTGGRSTSDGPARPSPSSRHRSRSECTCASRTSRPLWTSDRVPAVTRCGSAVRATRCSASTTSLRPPTAPARPPRERTCPPGSGRSTSTTYARFSAWAGSSRTATGRRCSTAGS
jgi:hypothetical protein